MALDPKTMSNPEAVRKLRANAERLNEPDIAAACDRRLYELSGAAIEDPLERRLWQAVAAYEETLFKKHGKNQKAGYTRRKIKTKGAIVTLTDWALNPVPTPGFEALVSSGSADFTGEYVVVEFADQFPENVVEAARLKLEAVGVELPHDK